MVYDVEEHFTFFTNSLSPPRSAMFSLSFMVCRACIYIGDTAKKSRL